MPQTVAILYGSVRASRLGIRAVTWMTGLLETAGYRATVVDQQEYQLPLLVTPMHQYGDPSEAPENVRAIADILTAADGFVVVGGEYNHAIQPGLSNLIDHFYRSQYGRKPGLIVTYSYGPFGGVRASTQLRTHLAEVGMVTVPSTIAIGKIHESIDAEGKPMNAKMVEYAEPIVEEFGFYLRALAAERAKG